MSSEYSTSKLGYELNFPLNILKGYNLYVKNHKNSQNLRLRYKPQNFKIP